jgi:hypothetical protein
MELVNNDPGLRRISQNRIAKVRFKAWPVVHCSDELAVTGEVAVKECGLAGCLRDGVL